MNVRRVSSVMGRGGGLFRRASGRAGQERVNQGSGLRKPGRVKSGRDNRA